MEPDWEADGRVHVLVGMLLLSTLLAPSPANPISLACCVLVVKWCGPSTSTATFLPVGVLIAMSTANTPPSARNSLVWSTPIADRSVETSRWNADCKGFEYIVGIRSRFVFIFMSNCILQCYKM